MNQNDICFLKRVTGTAPLQFFGQSTAKNNCSQSPDFFLPFVVLAKIKIDLWIHCIQFLICIFQLTECGDNYSQIMQNSDP
jgi:hypothetical protein